MSGPADPARQRAAGFVLALVGAIGFCGYCLASSLDFLGLQHVTASLERLILYLNPSIVLLRGEPFTAWLVGGTLLVLGGITLLARAR